MTKVEFQNIPLLLFGNELTIKGIIFDGNGDRPDLIAYLPGEVEAGELNFIRPSVQEWYELQDQLDKCNVQGEAGIILRKGQRQLDQKIAWQVYRRDKYRCRYCGIDNVPLTVDHIITWETGGATHEKNLLTACKKCNRKRGNLDYGSWLQHKYYIEKCKFLPESIKLANEAIVKELNKLPRLAKPRSR